MENKCFWNIYSLLLFIFWLSEEALHAQARMCFSASKTFDAERCEGRSAAAADRAIAEEASPPSRESAKGMVFPAGRPGDLDFDNLPTPLSAKLPGGIVFPASPPDDVDFDSLPTLMSAKLPEEMVFPALPPDDVDFDRLPSPMSAKLPQGVFPASPPDDVD